MDKAKALVCVFCTISPVLSSEKLQ